ncbi:hypothetical protein AB1N83_014281 [Pleurotus pulmonarius]|nr:hypothetical protein EYR38_001565 [Pleurotus pulmonarius]
MIFSRLLPLFALALSFSFVSVAKPIAEAGVVKRAGPDVAAVLTSLKAKSDSVLSQINALVDSGNANSGNVDPLFEMVVDAFDDANAALSKQKGEVSTPNAGPTKAEVAAVIAPIVVDIAKTMEKAPVSAIFVLDLAMKDFLSTVEVNVGGTLAVLAGLLSNRGFLLVYVGLRRVAILLGLA